MFIKTRKLSAVITNSHAIICLKTPLYLLSKIQIQFMLHIWQMARPTVSILCSQCISYLYISDEESCCYDMRNNY